MLKRRRWGATGNYLLEVGLDQNSLSFRVMSASGPCFRTNAWSRELFLMSSSWRYPILARSIRSRITDGFNKSMPRLAGEVKSLVCQTASSDLDNTEIPSPVGFLEPGPVRLQQAHCQEEEDVQDIPSIRSIKCEELESLRCDTVSLACDQIAMGPTQC